MLPSVSVIPQSKKRVSHCIEILKSKNNYKKVKVIKVLKTNLKQVKSSKYLKLSLDYRTVIAKNVSSICAWLFPIFTHEALRFSFLW